jgi:hypothetical protein
MSTIDVDNHVTAPSLGNFTSDAEAHIWQAESLASILVGEGRESFDTYNDDIRDGVLFLLLSEIKRAHQAVVSERKEKASAQ